MSRRRNIDFTEDVYRMYPEFRERLDPDDPRPMVKNVTLCVTSDCQLRCTYCYERHKGSDYMSFETARKFLDSMIYGTDGMRDYVDPEVDRFIILEFIGGEPLLAVDLIDRVLDYWVDTLTELDHPWLARWRVSISTNGVAYFEPRVQRFVRKWGDVLSLSVTVDGNRELHDSCRLFRGTGEGSYDLAHAADLDIMSKGGVTGTKVTLSPDNLPHMYDALTSLLDDGHRDISVNCAYEPEYTVEDARLYYRQGRAFADEVLGRGLDVLGDYSITLFQPDLFRPLPPEDDRNWCGGLGDMLACDWDGRYYPCVRYMSMSLGDERPSLVIGDVDHGMLATREQRELVADMRSVTRRSQSTDECFDCPIAAGCSWCSAWNYQSTGSYDERNLNICPMHRARALFNCYFWNRYYRDRGWSRRMDVHIPEEWALELVDRDEWDEIVALSGE